MKKGNQFYLELQVTDAEDNILDISTVTKVQFNIGEMTKIYDINNLGEEVTYDSEEKKFKIWLTEDQTFSFDVVDIDCRILYKNNCIDGTQIISTKFEDVVKEEKLDVEVENIE